ncbi:myotrophin [Strongylocentrotus purpuratus]|uniref:Myotrophin n=1 Tax=Strongylocentrotus purpuratus TaxID=7668 RepID=A0A7M7RDY4_STRPU|nr:myotrophin [Strongylocentrotus purpuratus]|eukprot:XP_792242.1 PREDICTED: myotrophin [Strongylocentrotus purpuratus]
MADAVWAAQNGDVSKLQELQFDANEKIKGRTLLHVAADYGQAEVIEYLVEQKQADINAIDNNKLTVLLTAIYGSEGQERFKNCIKYLIKKGADKSGNAPNGSSYIDSTDDPEIKKLLA